MKLDISFSFISTVIAREQRFILPKKGEIVEVKGHNYLIEDIDSESCTVKVISLVTDDILNPEALGFFSKLNKICARKPRRPLKILGFPKSPILGINL